MKKCITSKLSIRNGKWRILWTWYNSWYSFISHFLTKDNLNMKTVIKVMAFKILNALVPLKRLTILQNLHQMMDKAKNYMRKSYIKCLSLSMSFLLTSFVFIVPFLTACPWLLVFRCYVSPVISYLFIDVIEPVIVIHSLMLQFIVMSVVILMEFVFDIKIEKELWKIEKSLETRYFRLEKSYKHHAYSSWYLWQLNQH